MKRALRIVFLLIGAGSAALSFSCKATPCPDTIGPDGGVEKHPNCTQLQTTIEYTGTARTGSGKWATGQAISITNVLGDVKVAADSPIADEVQISGTPFTRDTQDDTGKQSATTRLGNMASPTVTSDATSVVVKATGGGFDGYRLTVHIPSAFDGAITVNQDTGDATLHSATGAKSSTVHTGVGDITADNLTGTINLTSGNGKLTVSATPSGPGNVLQTDLGDINATIGMANLMITAKTDFGGTVSFPATWTMQTLTPDKTGGSATIGDGSGALNATTKNGSIFFQ